MGRLADEQWMDEWYGANATGGRFVCSPSVFRNWITSAGEPAPGRRAFPAEPGHHALHASPGCPWVHRKILMRRWKGLTDMVGVSVVHPGIGPDGWTFDPGDGGRQGP